MTPAEQVEAGLARQLADAEKMILALRNGRTADGGQLRALREKNADLQRRIGELEAERDTARRYLAEAGAEMRARWNPGADDLAHARARRDHPGLAIDARATPAGVELDVDLDPPPAKR